MAPKVQDILDLSSDHVENSNRVVASNSTLSSGAIRRARAHDQFCPFPHLGRLTRERDGLGEGTHFLTWRAP